MASSRRNSTSVVSNPSLSRRGSCDSETSSVFPTTLKKGKPVSLVKITFMGKSMELMVPMNEDINIYDGTDINATTEKKSKNTWVEMFDMIDLAFNNLQQQNKELKRTVNELSSKINKMVFHERKETSKTTESTPSKAKTNGQPQEYNQGQVQEINKKVDTKIQKVEENILQWIDEETKCLKDGLEKDLASIRTEVDTKNIELNSKVTATIDHLKEDVNEKVAVLDSKLTDNMFNNIDDDIPEDLEFEPVKIATKQILDLKNKLHHNCNTLRFLCSEPLSVQFSIWSKKELKVGLAEKNKIVPFNWINCNLGGAVDDDGISDITTICIPVSGPYLLSLGCTMLSNSGMVLIKRNNKETVMDAGRCDIVDLNEDDTLTVIGDTGTKAKDISLMGLLIRPRVFITPGTTL